MNTQELKARIAECIPYFQKQSAAGYNEGIIGRKAEELLRSCLTAIEEMEKENELLKVPLAKVVEQVHSKYAERLQKAEAENSALKDLLRWLKCTQHTQSPCDESGSHYSDLCEICQKIEKALQPKDAQ